MTVKDLRTVWIVEFGSSYDSTPWKIEGVFATEELADKYIKKRGEELVPSLFHKKEYKVKGV